MRPLTPPPELEFVDGPAIDDTDALREWLAAHDGERRQLRLPVSMDNGLGVSNFAVGSVAIDVDDTALGISLADRARSRCGAQARCRLWLEGYWSGGCLSLRRVGDPVGEGNSHAAIEAEKSEGQAPT
jgi:hypothetical protein